MLPTKIFLDLDDVLNRFTMYALAQVGCPVNFMSHDDYDPRWGFDIVGAANAILGPLPFPMTPEQFWKRITYNVWATVPVAEGASLMLDRCVKLVGETNVCILTSPIRDPHCASGKMTWIHDNLPPFLHRQFLIGSPKHLCASPDALLIDDSDKNVDAFCAAGGQAILVPRPWNSGHMLDTMEHLRQVFSELHEEKMNILRFRGCPIEYTPNLNEEGQCLEQ